MKLKNTDEVEEHQEQLQRREARRAGGLHLYNDQKKKQFRQDLFFGPSEKDRKLNGNAIVPKIIEGMFSQIIEGTSPTLPGSSPYTNESINDIEMMDISMMDISLSLLDEYKKMFKVNENATLITNIKRFLCLCY